MTTIVEALTRIAIQCRVKAPSSWVTATREDHVSLRDVFLGEAVDDILERVDLPSPIGAQYTLPGDGSETYDLPSAFKRLHRSALAVYDPFLDVACVPLTTDGDWTYQKDMGTAGTIRYYRLGGYDGNWTISFYDAPDDSIEVHYQTVNWMATAGGVAGSMFTAEDDVLLLPRRLVETGTVWRFRQDKGLPYEDKRMEYEALMARMSNDRRSRRIISDNQSNVRWQDLIPAFIPSS